TNAGDQVEYLIEVTDPSRIEPFTNHLILIAQAGSAKGGSRGGRASGGNVGKGNTGGGSLLALPAITEVTEENWGSHGFNEESALKIQSTDAEAYDFYVNA